jgi:cytochrome b6-f complex iron-sulfur subunit
MSADLPPDLPEPGDEPEPGDDENVADRPFSRRRFVRFLMSFSVVSSIAMVITPIVGFLAPSKTVSGSAGGKVLAGTLDTLPIGAGTVVSVGSKPAIVINTAAGVKAFSAICTHLGCIVMWDETASNIVCPCHDGRFSPASGAVISGPPPAPLPALNAVVEGNEIYIVTG